MRYHKSVFDVLTYCLVVSKKDAKKVAKKYNLLNDALPDDIGSDAYAYHDPNSRIVVVRLIADGLSLVEAVGLIVHEATHVKQYIMEQISEHNPSDEFEAYTMQEITKNLIKDYFKKKDIKLTAA
ncbi:hypothetical protein ACS8E2_12725 [Psychrobacter glaciei]|uniref:hypothetical protein n=1 Tax=Psychrobacter glaciei TaxID=619771 RepID=UPI003F4898E5